MVPFAVQKLLSLIKSDLFIFAFISFSLGDWFLPLPLPHQITMIYAQKISSYVFL